MFCPTFTQITFVLAPVAMLYCVGLRTVAEQMALALYMLCGLTRLSRINITVHLVPKNTLGRASYIEGLPTSYAALIISTTVAVFAWMDRIPQTQASDERGTQDFYKVHWAVVPLIALSAAMASKRLSFRFDGAVPVHITTAAIFITCWWILPL